MKPYTSLKSILAEIRGDTLTSTRKSPAQCMEALRADCASGALAPLPRTEAGL